MRVPDGVQGIIPCDRLYMQHVFRLFLAVLLFTAGAVLFSAGVSPAAQNVASPDAQYRQAATDWRALLKDEKRRMQRDPWLNLEKRFLAVSARDSKGDTGAKAQFQAARCREELAKRSVLTSDWRQAANLFLDLGKKYPRHSLADDGLFQAASIAATRLNKPDEARTICRTIIDKYSKGDMVGNARELLASLSPKGGKPAPAVSAKPPAQATPAAKPSPQAAKPSGAPPAAAKPAAQSAPAAAAPKPAAPTATALTRVICRGTSKHSTVLLELDGSTSFRYQYLAATSKRTARLVVDIDSVGLKPEVKPSVVVTGMAVTRVRTSVTGAKDKKGVRVIIDLGNVRHYTVDTGANPPGIHVQCSTARDLAGGVTPPDGGKDGLVVRGVYAGLGTAQPGTLMEQLGLTVKTIMIDAGHGGKDPGAIANGVTEKHAVLSLGRMLGERLTKQGFSVLYTRQKDQFVALDQRAVIANNKKADLFISLHVNASKDKKTNGLETYFLDLARTSSAATVAARENAVSVKSISDLQFILTDLMLTSKLQESQDLAASVHQNMFSRLKQAGFTMNDNGVRSAPFYVLMGARMPAVLVEIGYCSNDDDARRLKSQKYLERLADGITLGVVEYKGKLARFTGK